MNDENNQELVKAVDRLTREIKRTNEKVNAIFIFGLGLLTLRLSHDMFGWILGVLALLGGLFLLISSDRKL